MNVTALIVTWNRLPQLQNTMKATLALPFQRIVVVNNASTDGTDNWLSQITDERLHIVSAEKNLGGSEGFYLGSEYISQQFETDWVVFYDDDAWPAANLISKLKELDLKDSAVICSRVVDCKERICRMNLPWTKRTASWRENLSYMKGDKSFTPDVNNQADVISCSFVGAIVNAKVLQSTYHLIHRELFIYYDDVYYGYHLHLLGYKLHYRPELKMYHDIDERSNDSVASWKLYYLVRNMLMARRIFPDNSFFTTPAILSRLIKYIFFTLKEANRISSLRTLIRAIKDGL